MLNGTRETIERARELRRSMSLPEVLLWQELRKRPAGLKFRRQQAAGRNVTDFFCHAASLIIEVDGDIHNFGDQPDRDAARDTAFGRRGLTVLRIPAHEVLDNHDGVIKHIVAAAHQTVHTVMRRRSR
ncbi:endonuclease domain-containing protein [Sphingosinicella terrae]|uniref:endonuclease domain-containing protein n=1 Tax=Sphingosinicella terrae TaxID=2172047 RepID=UPI000E0DDFC7|nr:endonuclease domain-containing protein [Sphingosinicella terrae]